MKIAAIQLDVVFADVNTNLEKISKFISQAAKEGAELVILPEFFTSAIGFSRKMLDVVLEGHNTHQFMQKQSLKHNIILGGSFLLFDGYHAYNIFELVFPNGEVFSHKKDLPTQFENCYYTRGDTDHILHTPIGDIGVVLCWEMLRYDTLKRLSQKADIVLAGSCWWDLPDDSPPERDPLKQYNQQLALQTPVTFAKLLHLPVIHASHCGKVTAYNFPDKNNVSRPGETSYGNKLQTRQLVGAAQIISADGDVIARRQFHEGEGMLAAEMEWNKTLRKKAVIDIKKYWISDLPDSYIKAWENINPQGENYYNNVSLPYYQKPAWKEKEIPKEIQ